MGRGERNIAWLVRESLARNYCDYGGVARQLSKKNVRERLSGGLRVPEWWGWRSKGPAAWAVVHQTGDAHLRVNWLNGAFVWAVTTRKEATIYSARNRRSKRAR